MLKITRELPTIKAMWAYLFNLLLPTETQEPSPQAIIPIQAIILEKNAILIT